MPKYACVQQDQPQQGWPRGTWGCAGDSSCGCGEGEGWQASPPPSLPWGIRASLHPHRTWGLRMGSPHTPRASLRPHCMCGAEGRGPHTHLGQAYMHPQCMWGLSVGVPTNTWGPPKSSLHVGAEDRVPTHTRGQPASSLHTGLRAGVHTHTQGQSVSSLRLASASGLLNYWGALCLRPAWGCSGRGQTLTEVPAGRQYVGCRERGGHQ